MQIVIVTAKDIIMDAMLLILLPISAPCFDIVPKVSSAIDDFPSVMIFIVIGVITTPIASFLASTGLSATRRLASYV
uniref:Uncharacterized protein n=1 Tax=Arundo donax TaxID=35708 RepID=A0A0A9HF06_ARUDO